MCLANGHALRTPIGAIEHPHVPAWWPVSRPCGAAAEGQVNQLQLENRIVVQTSCESPSAISFAGIRVERHDAGRCRDVAAALGGVEVRRGVATPQ